VGAHLTGSWKLVAWRRVAGDGTITYPLGQDASGLLIYTADGHMAVVIAGANRAPVVTDDPPLGGDLQPRADAYSSCLAYAGSYELQGDTVVHHIAESLYPAWSGEEQSRPFTLDDDELVLRTPPVQGAAGTVVNELHWKRA
jgi:hypothetical protein